jgi:ribosomal protein S18 acetylase RimI-like enzyme
MNSYHLTLLDSADNPDEAFLYTNLRAYNASQVGNAHKGNLTLSYRDADHRIVAGLHGITSWNWLFVQLLWVHEAVRRQGLGKRLLELAEAEGKKRGCENVSLDTFSFQAPGFYEKLGYEKFGELLDCPKGHRRIYFQKKL